VPHSGGMGTLEIPGFRTQRRKVAGLTMNVATAGEGPPILLLHGFPETHLTWRHVAPALAKRHTVVCPDLRGYGDSDKPADDPAHERYAKRTMAADVIGLMEGLGHRTFAVAGHDRGGLVAFRAALDRPDVITRLAVLDILPSFEMWRSLTGVAGVFAFHLFLLAQPAPLPERMIGADPETFFAHFLDGWTQVAGAIPPEVKQRYLAQARAPEAIHAICADYRASAFVDPAHDEEDRRANRRLAMPLLALWQDPGDRPLPFDPRAIWASWAPQLTTRALPCGHFLPEEQPQAVAAALTEFLA
jgi:haloacetate dehalogenase